MKGKPTKRAAEKPAARPKRGEQMRKKQKETRKRLQAAPPAEPAPPTGTYRDDAERAERMTSAEFQEANRRMAQEQADALASHQRRVAERVVDMVNEGALGPNVSASLAPASDPSWNQPGVEHVRAAQRICTCANGHDEGCPQHGTDDFARSVKTSVGAHLLANPGKAERAVKQRRLDGSEIDVEDVEVERVSKSGAKLKAGLFTISISDDDAEELRDEDPVTRRAAIAAKMHARKDGGRVPNGTDWDRSLDKLTLKVEQGW